MRSRVGQRLGSGARGLELAKGQKPTAEAIKIQEVQEVDIGRQIAKHFLIAFVNFLVLLPINTYV